MSRTIFSPTCSQPVL